MVCEVLGRTWTHLSLCTMVNRKQMGVQWESVTANDKDSGPFLDSSLSSGRSSCGTVAGVLSLCPAKPW